MTNTGTAIFAHWRFRVKRESLQSTSAYFGTDLSEKWNPPDLRAIRQQPAKATRDFHFIALIKALGSPSNQDECSPIIGKVLAVALFHLLTHFELRLFQCLVNFHSGQPLGVETLHQLKRFLIGHGPQ